MSVELAMGKAKQTAAAGAAGAAGAAAAAAAAAETVSLRPI